MSEQQPPRLRHFLIALVMLAELAHLTWEHFNGGVRSHHILNRSDLPAISNWLGAVLLPVLTWFLTGRIQRRSKLPVSIMAGFVGSLLFGILLSASFTNDYGTIASYLFGGMFLLALLLPVYRAECVLGFVLGMTFTFGAVLPTVIGSMVAAVSAIMHLGVRPALVRLWPLLRSYFVQVNRTDLRTEMNRPRAQRFAILSLVATAGVFVLALLGRLNMFRFTDDFTGMNEVGFLLTWSLVLLLAGAVLGGLAWRADRRAWLVRSAVGINAVVLAGVLWLLGLIGGWLSWLNALSYLISDALP